MRKRMVSLMIAVCVFLASPVGVFAIENKTVTDSQIKNGIVIEGSSQYNSWTSLQMIDSNQSIVYFSAMKTSVDSPSYKFEAIPDENAIFPLSATITCGTNSESFVIAKDGENSGSGGIEEKPEVGSVDLLVTGTDVKKEKGFTLKELKTLSPITKTYTFLNSYGTKGSGTYTGVSLETLLNYVGMKTSAKSIRVLSSDGYYRQFNLDDQELGVYSADKDGNPMMVAWAQGSTNIPLQLIVGQTHENHINKQLWVSSINTIRVGDKIVESGSGSHGGYEKPKEEEPKEDLRTETVTEIIPLKFVIEGESAQAQAELSSVNQALENLKKAQAANSWVKPVICFDIKADDGQTKGGSLTLSKEIIKAMVNGKVTMMINTKGGQMILPPSAMMDLQKKGGTSFVIEMKDTKGQELSAEDQRIVGKRPMMTLDIRIDGKSIGNLGVPFFKGCIPYVRSTNENAGGLFAKYMGKDNQPHIVKMSMYDDKTKMVKFAEKQLGVYAVGYNEVTFSDIGTHWAKSNIEFLAARDMVKGRGENRFEANGKVTRAEFIKMLVDSIDGLDVSGSQSMGYTDVVPGSWYADYVNWAGKKEIVKGFEDGTFRPAQLITREQMAVMTASFIKAVHGELNFVNKKTAFVDSKSMSSWAKDSVEKVQQYGIINGRPDNTFEPLKTATRGEASAIVQGYIEAVLR